jgi:hypothetical protein
MVGHTIIVIPKRAIPDPADMIAPRSLIQSNIAKGNFLPAEARFQVLQIAADSPASSSSHPV